MHACVHTYTQVSLQTAAMMFLFGPVLWELIKALLSQYVPLSLPLAACTKLGAADASQCLLVDVLEAGRNKAMMTFKLQKRK